MSIGRIFSHYNAADGESPVKNEGRKKKKTSWTENRETINIIRPSRIYKLTLIEQFQFFVGG